MISVTESAYEHDRNHQWKDTVEVTIRQRLGGLWACGVSYDKESVHSANVEVSGNGETPKEASEEALQRAATLKIDEALLTQAMSACVTQVYDLLDGEQARLQKKQACGQLLGLLMEAGGLRGEIYWDGETAQIAMHGWNGLEIEDDAQKLAAIWLDGEEPRRIRFAYRENSDSLEIENEETPSTCQ